MAGPKQEATLLVKIKEQGSDILDSIQSKITGIGLIGAGVFTSIAAFIFKSVEAYAEQEKAVNELTASMVQQGVYTAGLRDKYVEMANAMEAATGFADEQIVASQAVLQAHIGQRNITEDLMKATLDLAAAKKIDLASAADMIGKTIASENNLLARQGIAFDNTTKGAERMAQVISAVEGKYNGMAEAQTKGLGSLLQLKAAFSNFMEAIGSKFAPFAETIIRGMTKMFSAITPPDVSKLDGLNEKLKQTVSIIKQLEKSEKGNIEESFELKAKRKEYDELIALKIQHKAKEKELEDQSRQASMDNAAADAQLKRDKIAEEEFSNQAALMEARKAGAVAEWASQEDKQIALADSNIKYLDKKISDTKSYIDKLKLLQEKGAWEEVKIDAEKNKQKEAAQKDSFSTIATLANSSNSTLAAIGKAAGITQIAIDTPVAISKAMAAFPPPFNFVAAGLVGTAMAAQAARLAGVQLAEGGIVMPSNGGTQATIGEGGRPEAVIPLPHDFDPDRGMGGGTTVVLQGVFMGDESQARQLAEIVDRQLYSMRKENKSHAFDSGVN